MLSFAGVPLKQVNKNKKKTITQNFCLFVFMSVCFTVPLELFAPFKTCVQCITMPLPLIAQYAILLMGEIRISWMGQGVRPATVLLGSVLMVHAVNKNLMKLPN